MNNCNLNPTYKELALLLFPVGHTIYTNDSSFNPNTYYGGTWEQVKDKFILACGDEFKINQTGGEKEVTLTVEQIPNHNHKIAPINPTLLDSGAEITVKKYSATSGSNTIDVGESASKRAYGRDTSYTGGSEAHNNMPPYVTRYVWTRTA